MGAALMHYTSAAALTGRPAVELKYEKVSTTRWDRGYHYVVGEKDDKYGLTITAEIDMAIRQVAGESSQER